MTNPRTTVFYVDGNARSRKLLGSVLAECGFKMITASDPIEALHRCKEISFDVGLFNYHMPSLSGSQLALEIKLLLPDVPIVLLSGKEVLPASDLVFVDAHFGHGTDLDDLVHAMRRLTDAKSPRVNSVVETRWSDST
jgi:CheY-like chemotaxis protein